MLRIGMVDLDTSHPGAWIKIIRELNSGADVVAVYDGGAVYEKGYAKEFAAQSGVASVCESLDEMVELVDVAFIHGVNWDLHVERARPFIEAGKGVFIDKPMAGNIGDLDTILKWHESGAGITGGASPRDCREVMDWKSNLAADERIISVFASTSLDEFNYACHAVEMIGGLLGRGARSVDYIGGGTSEIYRIVYEPNLQVILQLECPSHHFFMAVTTDKNIYHFRVDPAGIYEAIVRRLIPFFKGDGNAVSPMTELIESIRILLCCRKARETGASAALRNLSASDAGFDGASFAKKYRKDKFRK